MDLYTSLAQRHATFSIFVFVCVPFVGTLALAATRLVYRLDGVEQSVKNCRVVLVG